MKVRGWTLLSRKQALTQELEEIEKDTKEGVLLHHSIIEQYKQQLAEVNEQLVGDRQKERQLKNILYLGVKKSE